MYDRRFDNWMIARSLSLILLAALICLCGPIVRAADDILIADFEGDDYGDWTLTGTAFGKAPATGTIGNQQNVSGFQGRGLVNTFIDGDRPTGTATSPEFVIERPYINLLVGGGAHRGRTCVELRVEGKPVATVEGDDNERLDWAHFHVKELIGKRARIHIIDNASGGWGHINADQITQSDQPRGRIIPLPGEPSKSAVENLLSHGVKEIVFATRQVDGDGHWYANFSYWSSDPNRNMYHNGGRLVKLNIETGETTFLIDDTEGSVRDPRVHYDGERILFSYRKGGQPFYHLYEINVDGTGLTQLTDGPYDDIEPTYLPGGDIVFCSSRCNRMVNCWHVRVAIVYRCKADGSDIRPLSCNIEQDNTPWVLPDGRIIYQRWEYIDRSQVRYHHLWTMNPDGTGQMVYYGNMHGGTLMIDAKPIPGTQKVVSLFSPGHGRKEHEGYVTIVDPSRGPDEPSSAQRVSEQMFRDPYPLSADAFIVATQTDFGVLDSDGRYQMVWSIPPEWRASIGDSWVHEPRPIIRQTRERVMPDRVDRSADAGVVLLDNAYFGRNMTGVEPGDIKKLLILEALPKPVNFSGGYEPISFGGTFTLERVLGTVPVEEDGSAHFELPPLRSIFFVALDENNMSVKRMQSFMSVQPGERLSCIGCHENRGEAPPTRRITKAMCRPPSKISPIEGIPDVFDFPRDIQPILDKHCVACHDYEKTARGGPRAGGVILSGDHSSIYSHSYYTLIAKGLVMDGRNGDGNRPPRSIGTSASPLMSMLDGSHYDVKLLEQEKRMIHYWIESAIPYPGTYASLGSGMVGGQSVEDVIESRCASCHTGSRKLPPVTGRIILNGFYGGGRVSQSNPPEAFLFSSQIIYNLSRPELSMALLAPLSKGAGGYGMCGRPAANGKIDTSRPIFASTDDPDYVKMLEAIERSKAELERIKRFDMPGFLANQHYLREMKVYGILPPDHDDTTPIDVYETDEKYWRSFWYKPTGQSAGGIRSM